MITDDIPYEPAPGDEGLDLSHEGGEYEAFEGLSRTMADLSGFRYVDPRTQCDRTDLQTNHWDMQMNELVHAYLEYRSRDSGDGIPTVLNENDSPSLNTAPALCNIELVDTFSSFNVLPCHKYPNETLIYNGYLGCLPLFPNIAISLRTLAAYRQAHRTSAYDAFLEIVYRVDVLLKQALKHDTPNWRLLNACPACTYKLVDESPLQFAWFATIDGNNSVKRWASSSPNSLPRDDSRRPRSDYWIGHDAVDKFKDEVRSRTPYDQALDKNDKVDDWEDVRDDHEVPGEAVFHCTARWRNAGPEQRKKMFSVFDESGIFIAACRHRFVLVACNMIRSGEL
ncbi:hypothetical protein EV702DRAFT_1177492 [Suillus placidus]|uniref:Uncharacterized protein n=1 Tax=Suillus placidus TaxID=48579 RepID=A0A9P7A3P1_9AGAM|nr:hypothetical protein EV702DRAFT_1177492 [Suillus placidus]